MKLKSLLESGESVYICGVKRVLYSCLLTERRCAGELGSKSSGKIDFASGLTILFLGQ